MAKKKQGSAKNPLASLRPGDKVAVKWSCCVSRPYTITWVKRITPSGKIVCEDGNSFDRFGNRSGQLYGIAPMSVHVLTDEICAEIARGALLSKVLHSLDLVGRSVDNLPTESLKRVSEVLTEAVAALNETRARQANGDSQ